MSRYPDIHQQLKDLVRPALKPYGAKAALARKMRVAQSYINQWMDDGRHNPGVDKLPAIADFLACSFVVHKSAGLTSHVMPSGGQLLHTHTPGGAADALAQDRLQEQVSTLTNENAALRLALDDMASGLKRLTAIVKARKAQGGKPDPGGNR